MQDLEPTIATTEAASDLAPALAPTAPAHGLVYTPGYRAITTAPGMTHRIAQDWTPAATPCPVAIVVTTGTDVGHYGRDHARPYLPIAEFLQIHGAEALAEVVSVRTSYHFDSGHPDQHHEAPRWYVQGYPADCDPDRMCAAGLETVYPDRRAARLARQAEALAAQPAIGKQVEAVKGKEKGARGEVFWMAPEPGWCSTRATRRLGFKGADGIARWADASHVRVIVRG